jgi:hypothetical protein
MKWSARRKSRFSCCESSPACSFHAGGMKLYDWFGGIPAQFGGHPKLLSQA